MDTEEAVDRGIEFLESKAGYYTHRLESVKLEENVWVVRFDVGPFVEKIVETLRYSPHKLLFQA